MQHLKNALRYHIEIQRMSRPTQFSCAAIVSLPVMAFTQQIAANQPAGAPAFQAPHLTARPTAAPDAAKRRIKLDVVVTTNSIMVELVETIAFHYIKSGILPIVSTSWKHDSRHHRGLLTFSHSIVKQTDCLRNVPRSIPLDNRYFFVL